MKDESIAALIASGEVINTDDAIFMIDMVTTLFDRAAETERDSFVSLGVALLEIWRESLETVDVDAADAAISIVMGRQS